MLGKLLSTSLATAAAVAILYSTWEGQHQRHCASLFYQGCNCCYHGETPFLRYRALCRERMTQRRIRYLWRRSSQLYNLQEYSPAKAIAIAHDLKLSGRQILLVQLQTLRSVSSTRGYAYLDIWGLRRFGIRQKAHLGCQRP